MKLEKLFEPMKLGKLELPNRIVMPAITTRYDLEGAERLASFYAARARGGVGLIIIGALQVLFPGRRTTINRININDDRFISELRKITTAIHVNGGLAAAQLATYGYWSPDGTQSTPVDVGPSDVVIPTEGLNPNFARAEFPPHPRALTVEEIHRIEEAIGRAAGRAIEAGFDAVELQIVGGNLLVRFLNPFTNRRVDEYGGSVENRTRIIVNAIKSIKRSTGKDFPLICRITGIDMVPWGLSAEEWKGIASILEKAGANALSVFPGWHETREAIYQMCVPRGAFVGLSQMMKEAVKIPVSANVRINDPILAEKILKEGKADFIDMARALIADPDLPIKAKKSQVEDILMCTGCSSCWDTIAKGEPLICSINPLVGQEGKIHISPVSKKKRILVIGGGPGGMEAAKIAAQRGHRVTLWEKREQLGGQVRYATIPPFKDELWNLVGYFQVQLKKLSVEVELNKEARANAVRQFNPDVVIVATGARQVVPEIIGIHLESVITALDVLVGNRDVGEKVIIVGGGSLGCETAEFLFRRGRRVTIIEALDRILADCGERSRWIMIDRLNAARIRVETNCCVEEITSKGVRVKRTGGFHEFFEGDAVVIAMGMKPDDQIARELESFVPSLFKIGDCLEPHKLKEAIEGGFRVAMDI